MNYQVAGFDLPLVSSHDKLTRILPAALEGAGGQGGGDRALSLAYWDAAHFNLHRVRIFREASQEEQRAILAIANRGVLEEAYFVERAGMGYMAKMVLLAETLEERMLYGLFTADETTHFAQIRQFLPQDPTAPDDPFLQLLAELVESSDKTMLLFLVQVVLEGWGLSHYRSLAKDCRHPGLQSLLESFLQAESRHHATGFTLFDQRPLSLTSHNAIIEALSLFLSMVQVGPQRVLEAIALIKGHLSPTQKITILEELDTETHSHARLHLLQSLMKGESGNAIAQTLEAQGMFTPLPAHQCIISRKA